MLEGAQLRQHRSMSPRNVKSGTLQLPGHSTLSEWFSFGTHTEKSMQSLLATMSARTGGEQERKSVYCQPRMGFVHSRGIKGFGKSKDYNTMTAGDPNISNLGGVGPERGLRGGGRRGWCEEWARSG